MLSNKLTAAEVEAARERILKYIHRTPLEKSIYLSSKQQNIYLKLECQQPVKSFKIRGAFSKLLTLTDEEKCRGIATVSSGNHGIAVSYAAGQLGIQNVKVIIPKTTPLSKVEKIRYYGGQVIMMGSHYDEAHREGMKYIRESGLIFIDGGDNDPAVYAGQGTVALEVLEQNPQIDTILVPIGGGGLSTGIAVAAKSRNKNIKVYGLYSEACPAWAASIRDRRLYHEYPAGESVCEAMVGGIGQLSYELRDWLDGSLEVKEEYIRKAMVHALLKEKIVAEASGSVPIAAVLQYQEQLPGKYIALIISGGNVDNQLLMKELQNYGTNEGIL
jgi:threonine dehydratase